MSFFENTRKPVGFGGKIMVAMMNLGHSAVAGGASISEYCAGRQGAGLRLRRWGEHPTAAEKMPTGRRQGHRLFARQRGEVEKGYNDVAIAEGRCAVLQGSVADMMFTDNWFDAVTAFENRLFLA